MRNILFPGKAVIVLLTAVSTAALIYIFGWDIQEGPLVYSIYLLSAYTLMIVVLALYKQIRKGISYAETKNQQLHRYLNDTAFRTHISLFTSLIINGVYAIAKFFSALFYHSFWFGSIAVYYLCLALMRFLLLSHASQTAFGTDPIAEYQKYRTCGIVLMVLNLALTGMVILVITKNHTYSYPGNMIYAMSAYAFYSTITAGINVVKFRSQNSPALSASKIINLAAALVSMLALETAMMEQFGSANTPLFRRVMTSATGGGVCLIILGMAVYMIGSSTRNLKRLKEMPAQ